MNLMTVLSTKLLPEKKRKNKRFLKYTYCSQESERYLDRHSDRSGLYGQVKASNEQTVFKQIIP